MVLKEEADVLKGFEGIKQIIKNKRLRLDLIILTWSNVSCAIVYYGVSFSAKSLSGNPNINMLYMGIFDFFAIPATLVFNNRLGRKKTFLIYITLSSLFLASILAVDIIGDIRDRYPVVITIFALSARFGIVSSWGALSVIIMETFPTTFRSTCLGFIAFSGYLGGVAAPQTIFLGNISASLPYIFYCSLTVSSSILSWFLYEMAGEPLKDTAGA
ncbi:unnamed protein product [Allacma fusca]|uniref:Major facilitator superfamily (MFS) profile domain-containing protein n=1 Tax=Allacma fusca TaxID=39272 RepID=A0A8J2JVS9_9HEXA|nr:unnamed protein product [Allacma fusca]